MLGGVSQRSKDPIAAWNAEGLTYEVLDKNANWTRGHEYLILAKNLLTFGPYSKVFFSPQD